MHLHCRATTVDHKLHLASLFIEEPARGVSVQTQAFTRHSQQESLALFWSRLHSLCVTQVRWGAAGGPRRGAGNAADGVPVRLQAAN